MGRMDSAPARPKSGFGKVGFAMTGRGVKGGFVMVTMRFCWLVA